MSEPGGNDKGKGESIDETTETNEVYLDSADSSTNSELDDLMLLTREEYDQTLFDVANDPSMNEDSAMVNTGLSSIAGLNDFARLNRAPGQKPFYNFGEVLNRASGLLPITVQDIERTIREITYKSSHESLSSKMDKFSVPSVASGPETSPARCNDFDLILGSISDDPLFSDPTVIAGEQKIPEARENSNLNEDNLVTVDLVKFEEMKKEVSELCAAMHKSEIESASLREKMINEEVKSATLIENSNLNEDNLVRVDLVKFEEMKKEVSELCAAMRKSEIESASLREKMINEEVKSATLREKLSNFFLKPQPNNVTVRNVDHGSTLLEPSPAHETLQTKGRSRPRGSGSSSPSSKSTSRTRVLRSRSPNRSFSCTLTSGNAVEGQINSAVEKPDESCARVRVYTPTDYSSDRDLAVCLGVRGGGCCEYEICRCVELNGFCDCCTCCSSCDCLGAAKDPMGLRKMTGLMAKLQPYEKLTECNCVKIPSILVQCLCCSKCQCRDCAYNCLTTSSNPSLEGI